LAFWAALAYINNGVLAAGSSKPGCARYEAKQNPPVAGFVASGLWKCVTTRIPGKLDTFSEKTEFLR